MPDEDVGRTGYDILLKQITGLDTRLTGVQEQLKALDAKMDVQSAGLLKIIDSSLPAIYEKLEKVSLIDQRLMQNEVKTVKIETWIEKIWGKIFALVLGVASVINMIWTWFKSH